MFFRRKNKTRPGYYCLINLATNNILKILTQVLMNSISNFYGEWIFFEIGKKNFN